MTEAAVRLGTTCAWKGTSLLLTTSGAECGPADPLSGFYVREVRHLSVLRFEVNGERPWLCEWARPGADELAFVFVHPELTRFGGGGSGVSDDEVTRDAQGIPHRALDIRLTYRVELHRLRARAIVTNRSRERVSVDTSWVFAADYADLLEAQDGQRRQEAPVEREVRPDGVRLRYLHDRLPFETVLTLAGPGRHDVAQDRWTSRLQLASGEGASLDLVVEAHDPDLPLDDGARAERMRVRDQWQRSMTRIAVPANTVAEVVLARARDDLAAFPLLEGEPDEWLALQAGVPLYPAFFGRDALTAGWQAGMLDRAPCSTRRSRGSAGRKPPPRTNGATPSPDGCSTRPDPARWRGWTSTPSPPTTPTSPVP